MSVNENSHQRTKRTRSSAPSLSSLILEGGSAPSDGVAAAVAAPCKCVGCSADVANSSYAQIIGGRGASSHGCMHTVCMQCFGSAHALRSADIKLKCPGFSCAYQSRRWIVHSPVASRTGSTRSWQQIEQCIVLPLDFKRHPNLFFQHQPEQYRDVHSILSLVTKNRANPRASNYYAVELRNDSTNQELSNGGLSGLQEIGMALHPCLVPPDNHPLFSTSQSAFSGGRSIAQLEQSDNTPLRRLLHCVATGEDFQARTEDSITSPYQQRAYNASHVAANLIMTAKGGGRKGSKLKDYVSDKLSIAGVSERVKDLFCSLGLCRSIKYMNLAADKAVDSIIREGWDPKGRAFGLLIQTYDNMGMRKRMGYVQYTLLILIYMPVEKLIEMNIYPNPARSDHEAACSECLSWSGRAWSDVKDITEAEADEDHSNDYFDFSITNADGVLLASEVTLPSIEFIIMAMNKHILPTLDESREMIQANTFDTDTDQTISHSASGRVTSMSMNTDEVTMNMAELNVREFEVDDINDLDEDGLHHENKSIYEINNAKMDVPWQLDLNNKNTVKKLMTNSNNLRERCLAGTRYKTSFDFGDADEDTANNAFDLPLDGNPWAQNDWPEEYWPEPLMSKLGVFLCGDGHPTFAALRLKRDDPEFQDMKVQPLNGGFHTMLELHKLRGKMFGPTHLREIWHRWRPTDAQKNWVMTPGDPNQVEDELVMYYIGAVASAVMGLLEKREEDGNTNDVGVSAIDIHNYMKRAAQSCPIVQNIYNELRFAEVIFMLQQAEEEGNAEKFVTAMKFAACLFAASHATKYCNIAAEFLIWWHCASEAEKAIFEKYIMVRKTKEGKTIYTDRFVEWSVRDMRGGVGKHFRRGTDTKVSRQAVLLELGKEFNTTSDRKRSSDHTTRKVGKVFCHTVDFFCANKLWSWEDINRFNINRSNPKTNPEMIDMPVVGEVRMNSYISINFKQDRFQDDESNGTAKDSMLLKQINPTVEIQLADDKVNLDRAVSTTPSFVETKYTMKELKSVLNALKQREWNYDDMGDFPNVAKNKKEGFAVAICDARKRIIANHPIGVWEAKTKETIQSLIDARDAESADGIQNRLLNIGCSNFFHLAMLGGDDTHERFSRRIIINESGGDLAMNENGQQVASMPSPMQPTSRFASVYKNRRIL